MNDVQKNVGILVYSKGTTQTSNEFHKLGKSVEASANRIRNSMTKMTSFTNTMRQDFQKFFSEKKPIMTKDSKTKEDEIINFNKKMSSSLEKGFEDTSMHQKKFNKSFKEDYNDLQKSVDPKDTYAGFDESFKKVSASSAQFTKEFEADWKDLQKSTKVPDVKTTPLKNQLTEVENSMKGVVGQSSDLGREFSELRMSEKLQTKSATQQTATNMRFGDVLSMNMETFKEMSPVIAQYGNRSARAANNMRMLTHGMRGFKMEFLSVMFFGMAMQKFFGGLLQPAMQAAGIFEIISSLLLVLFLPIVLDHVLPAVLWLFEKLSGLSEPVKKWLGWVVIAGSIIGTIMAVVGTVFLGAGGTIMTFGGIIAGIISGPIGWMALAIVGLSYLWAVFGNDIKKIIGKLKNWLFEKWTGIKEDVKVAFTALKLVGISILKKLTGDSYDDLVAWKDKLVGIWESVKTTATEKLEPILDFINKLKIKINDFLDALPDFIKNWIGVGEFRFTVTHEGTGAIPPSALPKPPSMVPKPLVSKSPYEELWEQKEQSIIPLEDFVMTGGRMYKTHPDDTVVGAKGGLGDTYNLTVNVSGNDMSNDRELAEKIGEVVTAQLRNVTIR